MMVRNYLKVGLRNLKKSWANSLINISGLTLSVGCAITTFLFADFFFNLNSIHSQKENIYQVVSHIEENQKEVKYGPSPMILAERLKEDIPSVSQSVRVQYDYGNVKFGPNVFRERVQFADPSYFKIFDFPLIKGQDKHFIQGNVFISEEMSVKYFGRDDPMGQTIDIKFGNVKTSYTVAGIFGVVPANTTFKPEILLPFQTYISLHNSQENWINETQATFVLLEKASNPYNVSQSFESYIKTQNEANSNQPILNMELLTIQNLGSRRDIQEAVIRGNGTTGTIGIAATGILLILFACLNYVNIAISSSVTRLKEIGVRKVLGSSRFGIAQQFLTENFLTCAFAMIFGVAATFCCCLALI